MAIKEGSPWKEGLKAPVFPKLEGGITADVCIIGGGITGVLAAYMLAKEGKDVVLLERGAIASEATGDTTAFITQVIDTNAADLISTFGIEKSKKILASHAGAIDLVERIVAEEDTECDFMRVSNFIYASAKDEVPDLEAECMALEKLGIIFGRGTDTSFRNVGMIEIPNQAKFHPLKFVYALAEILRDAGVRIYEHTEISRIEEGPLKRVHGLQAWVDAPWVISATYSPFSEPLGVFFKKAMYITYMYELDGVGPIPEGTYEDLRNPYHYFRYDQGRVILGGEDHRHDIPVDAEKNFAALEEYARSTFGKGIRITRRWQGGILEPIDGLAYIGSYKDSRMLYAFGFSGNGMTYAGIAAQLFADLVEGRRNPYADVYKVDRVPSARSLMTKGRDYMEELAGGAIKNATSYPKHKKDLN